jgi:hypothetical protein
MTTIGVSAVASAIALSHMGPASNAVAASVERHVFVCKNPVRAPEARVGPGFVRATPTSAARRSDRRIR